ncbi:MAG: hypothetical protein AB7H90_06520 [Alphaproteobacteria bacterium]
MIQVLLRVVALLAALGLPAAALAYDPSWYRMEQWSGEYPGGFTMTGTRTVALRERPDPEAPRTVPCRFEKDATYHPWNQKRVAQQDLQFVSFTKSREFVVQTGFRDVLFDQAAQREVPVGFNPGDRWRYLAYLAEGRIVLDYRGSRYTGDQTLFEHSAPLSRGGDAPEAGYDEWMRVSCPDGAQGWLFIRDIADAPGFDAPHIIRYGTAADRAADPR